MTRYAVLACVCLILTLQAGASKIFRIDEQKIGTPGLHGLSSTFGKWTLINEQALDAGTVQYLRPDEYVLRDYASSSGATPVNLFVAFFKSLQSNYGPHSPRICLPGAGWLVSSSQVVDISIPGRGEPISVNRYTMEKDGQRILVLYWYQNSRDTWSEEYSVKLRLLPDLIRYHRSDISLVRLIAPLSGPDSTREFADCAEFSRAIFPELAERFGTVH